ncbi:LLM class flavin-dependent oxidoreductase [Quadrisphaera sp. DSM 44207]|uniref:LLM class flavin-dependent oxidoreductase n=1 Tax=Quadrisphaera sp. DSM 44207 TaxID=1881057 RepID=UPI000880509E|nr:LLM class flavin-dependent oxidoreductase [Quadrisphaera sp. DSM 44207]SDQ22248.1 limonene 1,2-monooxygenase [Quadrisphaera sp. DSM 44207]
MPTSRLKFGVLTFPVHRPTHNPTLQLETDLQLVEHCDRLGYDEFWFGEHHSGGWQVIASPELMIAAAAQRTRSIRLGTGVATLSYHHPLTLLDRIVQLDHLTRGRLVFGVGAGALALDSTMIGHDPMQARRMMEEALEVITELLRYEGPVSRTTDWFVLRDAQLHLRPHSEELDIRVAAFKSPSGPRLAGRFGAGMLQFGASASIGGGVENPMTTAWEVAEEQAERYGQVLDRRRWSVVSPVHVAETEEQARAEVRWGLRHYIRFMSQVLPMNVPVDLDDVDAVCDVLGLVGHAVVGTPAQAIAHIEKLQEISGGFGTFVIEHGELADPEASKRSYDLFAREVIPHFTQQTGPRVAAWQRELAHDGMTRRTMAAAQARAGIAHSQEQAARRAAGETTRLFS